MALDPIDRFTESVRRAAEMWRAQFEGGVLTGFHLEAEVNERGEWETRGGPVHNQRVYAKLAKKNECR